MAKSATKKEAVGIIWKAVRAKETVAKGRVKRNSCLARRFL